MTSRIQKLCYGLNMEYVDPLSITLKVIRGLYPGVTTIELDTLAAETAATMTTHHPDHAVLAARIAVSNLHKETKKHFSDAMPEDSLEGIFDCVKQCAMISKSAGRVGLHIHNIRATNTPIVGTGGVSNGLVPMLKVFNATAHYVDQGRNKRPGAFAIYLEPWHADIIEISRKCCS